MCQVLTRAEAVRESMARQWREGQRELELDPKQLRRARQKGRVGVGADGKVTMQLPLDEEEVEEEEGEGELSDVDEGGEEWSGMGRMSGRKGGFGGSLGGRKQTGGRNHSQAQGNKKRQKLGGHSGKAYASRRAGGDVKKQGALQPFAYLPMDPAHLNKRSGKHKVRAPAPCSHVFVSVI